MLVKPNAPLYRDPIFDGAADPTIIWTEEESCWTILYTNRRANVPCDGWTWAMGTDVGVAQSTDGLEWTYRGILPNLNFEPGRNTFWAPEIVKHDGVYHIYCSYVRGIPLSGRSRHRIVHYSGKNIWDMRYDREITEFGEEDVIDAAVCRLPSGLFRMWAKVESKGATTECCDSPDLIHWTYGGPVITDVRHEGPNVFHFKGSYWMITDEWKGLGLYRSPDGIRFKKCQNRLLDMPGKRRDDGRVGNHADVLVNKGRAYIFYFTHPESSLPGASVESIYRRRRSSLQVAELGFDEAAGTLFCNRDEDGPFLDLSR